MNQLQLLPEELFGQVLNLIPTGTRIGTEARNDNAFDYKTIISAFDAATDNKVPTLQMCKRVIKYSWGLASRDEHITFFGGNLLGVDRIKMLPSDRDEWFDEILEIDEDYLRECIHSVPAINTDWIVTSDVFNLSVVWFIHHCFKSLRTTDSSVQQAMVEALVVLQFKFLTSIYHNYFKKPVDHEAAEATYAALTMKFNIKRYGSWGEMMRQRASSMIAKDSPHYRTFNKFDIDEDVMYIITDLQTRTRKTIKDQYKVLDKVRRGNLRITTSSQTMEIDGDKIIRDQVSAYNMASRYLMDVSGNEASFIKRELVGVVLDLMGTVSRQAFMDLLISIANQPHGKEREKLEELMNDTLLHAFSYIANNRIKFNDVGFILAKMRALYMSSKSTDPTLLKLRRELEKYAKKYTHLRAPSALAAARTSMMLYFLLRALTAQTYR